MPTLSVDPHQLEKLLNYCVGFAQQMIQGHGEFHPFGAIIDSMGQHTAVGGYTGDELPLGSLVSFICHTAYLKGKWITQNLFPWMFGL